MVENHEVKNIVSGPPKRKRWSAVLLIVLLVGTTAILIFSMQWRATLKTQRVVVQGVTTLSAKDIVALAKVAPRSSMYSMNLAEIRDRIAHHPFILSVGVYRDLPNKINVDIVEREPVASINCGQLWYVDREGVLLPCNASARKFDLPLISGIEGVQNFRSGTTVTSKDVFEAINICQTAQDLDTTIYHMISEINMNNGGDIILYSAEAAVPVILGRDDVARKLLLLENFWSDNVGEIEPENIKYIDLRFKDQVVVKWAHPDPQEKKISS